jgi:hypothetical protein
MFGQSVRESQIRSLAESVHPEGRRLVRGGVDLFEQAFRDAIGRRGPNDTLKGAQLDFVAAAALGVLMINPERELAKLRPHLENYCREYAAEFRAVEESG